MKQIIIRTIVAVAILRGNEPYSIYQFQSHRQHSTTISTALTAAVLIGVDCN